jgi:hypothetical protein
VPLIVGFVVFTGAAPATGVTTLVAEDVAGVLPPALDAVTTTSTVWPTSPDART